ncbi:hypothetical protein N878_28020 [Pseudomonas sp. EGD-AK9]|nr:hypothetical protein N878_28020 [Pseudomonas sp. EGD-AK9]
MPFNSRVSLFVHMDMMSAFISALLEITPARYAVLTFWCIAVSLHLFIKLAHGFNASDFN